MYRRNPRMMNNAFYDRTSRRDIPGGYRNRSRYASRKIATTSQDLVRQLEDLGYFTRIINPDWDYIEIEPYDDSRYVVQLYKGAGDKYVVQTTSWGAIPTDEMGIVIDNYRRATDAAILLNSVDISTLEHVNPNTR